MATLGTFVVDGDGGIYGVHLQLISNTIIKHIILERVRSGGGKRSQMYRGHATHINDMSILYM